MTSVQPNDWWERLDPFEKARKWHEVDPQISNKLIKARPTACCS